MTPVLEQPQSPSTPSLPTVSQPRTRERGHLLLVDWEGVAPHVPAPPRPAAKTPAHANPLRRTWVDRAFSRGSLVLLALTALGVLASVVQH